MLKNRKTNCNLRHKEPVEKKKKTQTKHVPSLELNVT